MNVIVSNRQKEIIDNANIDAIKDLNGLFNVDDLINKFKNYFFSKMILDATSVVNFASKSVLTTLVDEIGAEKLIILLPSNPEPPVEFKKLLIDLKIYNFTNNIDDVVKFIENPNTYEDAIKTIDSSYDNGMYVDNSIKEDDNNEKPAQEREGDLTSSHYASPTHQSLGDIMNNFNLQNTNDEDYVSEHEDEEPVVEEENKEIEEPSQEETIKDNYEVEDDKKEVDENSLNFKLNFGMSTPKDDTPSGNTFLISDSLDENNDYVENTNEKMVIGVKNVTNHAGSTSLVYMMHKMATVNLKKDVLSIEIGKNDFKLYRDHKMISVEKNNVSDIIDKAKEEIIFVDLNECDDTSFCKDVLYLVEPSTLKLNKLMIENKNIFKDLKDKKVVINMSLLSNNDIRTLSSEAGMEFFDILEPLNDRLFNDSILNLLNQLNIK